MTTTKEIICRVILYLYVIVATQELTVKEITGGRCAIRCGTLDGIIEGDNFQVVYDSNTIGRGNLLHNGLFSSWVAGTSSAPDGWTLDVEGGTGAVAREGTIVKLGTYSAKITRGNGIFTALYNNTLHVPKGIAYWKSKTVYLGCWVYATVANRARISIYDGKTETFSSYHTGDSTWQWLTVTKTLASDATLLQVTLYVDTADTSAYFDGAIMMTSAVPASNTDTSYFDQTSISVTGLDGSNDDTYEIYSYIVNGYDGAANFDLQINGDTTAANYGYQWLRGVNATAASSRAADEAGFLIGLGADLGEISFNQSTLYAKTGYVRTNISKMTQGISGTTVTGVYLVGNSYNDTSTNITSLVIKSTGANGIGVGSRIIILRRNSLTSGSRTGVLDVQGQLKGCWQTVYKTTLAAAATSVSITGLDGDTAVMYRLRVRAVGGADGVGVWCLLNNDSGLTYGQQTLYNDDATTPAAIRHTPYASYDLFRKHIDTDELLLAESILYAKSGNLRVGITESSEGIATTTITTLGLVGHVWSNAADNITSIVVKSQTNGLGIGTVISVDAYRPQT